jgi:hypothetical protein
LIDGTPRTRVEKVEIGETEVPEPEPEPEPESAGNLDNSATESSSDEQLVPPANQTEETENTSAEAKEAGWRIRWNPVFAREV